ncbi:MAG: PQQ-dependent sugar dehydrogenase [Fodinibius sp.]|nr:PQQ-dependent sugar dehydrogenase [Fodinibius sp.]
MAVGDGGSGGDPDKNAQDRSTLLGSILRIDVDNPGNGTDYGIPSDNPYAENSQGFREEIYSFGLRNPWRFSFDAETGQLWAGDVSQNSYEEINVVEAGNNYGWDIMEGMHCYEPSSGCDQSGLAMPIWEYGRVEGISVTGGYVYRGASLNRLQGLYIYGDFGSGRIWALNNSDPDNPENIQLLDTDILISSFGVDAEHEFYICGFGGSIYRLEAE